MLFWLLRSLNIRIFNDNSSLMMDIIALITIFYVCSIDRYSIMVTLTKMVLSCLRTGQLTYLKKYCQRTLGLT